MAWHQPRKRFGQNFLCDQQMIDQIVAHIQPQPNHTLIEIGPGQGALTLPLLKKFGHLTVIELDRDLIPALQQRCHHHPHLTIHQADVLSFDFSQLGNALHVIGNLPYNISTPLLFHLLQYNTLIKNMLFMLQREVADRITAQPGDHNYGRLSIMVQQACQPEKLFDVPPSAFYPQPQVTSAIIRLQPHQQQPVSVENQALFAALVRDAFNQRRKSLSNSLKKYFTPEQLRACAINPQQRAQELSIEDYARLAHFLQLESDH
jgi:16S rRNA (adenine1518-N6/adenine1519-N6)-dimethyltransferase